jgi:AAA domain
LAPQTFPQYLVSLGIPEEVAAVLDPAEFYDDLNRAWHLELRKLKGEPPEGAGVSAFPDDLMARAAEIPKTPDITDVLDRIDLQLRPDAERFPCFSAAQLNSGRFETRYLIPGLLAAGQPGGIFGAFKTLKTSITADLLISLASGTPFLGHFPVSEPGRTLFLSGESGLAALQSIARRICASRGLSLEALENFELSPKLPLLNVADDARALRRIVRDKRPVCLAIDPAYLAIQSEDYRNLFAMGTLLRPLAELCDSTGCTILIVHHCKRSRVVPNDPATLEDIAWSGFAEFSAQWLLLSRRHRFDPDTGRHELWLNTGGRAGHHGLWALDVEEGNSEKPERRLWKPTLRRVQSAQAESEERLVTASEDRRMRRLEAIFDRDRRRTLESLAKAPGPVSARYLRNALGLNGVRMNRILTVLVNDGTVGATTHQSGDRTETAYSLSEAFKNRMESAGDGAPDSH